MTFREAIAAGFNNYAKFSGRAGLAEFLYWVLFIILGEFVAAIVDAAIFPNMQWVSPLSDVFFLITLLPSIAVSVRRLHDTDRSGWWFLLGPVDKLQPDFD